MVVFCVVLAIEYLFYLFRRVEHPTHANILPLFYGKIPCTNAHPEHRSYTAMHRGCVSGNKNGGVQFGLVFVLRGGNTPFFRTSVHFASMIDNLVLKIEYF